MSGEILERVVLRNHDNHGETPQSALQLALRANDVIEIQKLMALRAFYQAAGRHDLAFDLYSANVKDICWAEDNRFWIGYESIKEYYITKYTTAQRDELSRLAKIYPEIETDVPRFSAPPHGIHTITTSVVEVAEDRQTAKGLFYTPGALGFVNGEGQLVGYWMWERYAIDFVREGGSWKFWHIHIYTDFAIAMGEKFSGGQSSHIDPVLMQKPDGSPKPDLIQGEFHGWDPCRAKELYPKPPVPYRTFEETFSYGPA